jgi:hypothetical protein
MPRSARDSIVAETIGCSAANDTEDVGVSASAFNPSATFCGESSSR